MAPYMVIAVMILMVIMFVLNKWPFGLVTMTCCAILGVTGCLGPTEFLSGLNNPFVIMLASCFVVTNALAKTSFIHNVQKKVIQLQKGKSGALLMAIFVIATIVLVTFMPGPSYLALLIVMANNLSDEGDVNPARVIFPAAVLTTLWNGRIPIGIGAGNFAILNGFLEPYGEQYRVGMFDPMLAGLFPGIVLALYAIFCYKLLPHKAIDRSGMEKVQKDDANYVPQMSPLKEKITYLTFIVMIIMMVLNQITGNLMYVGPAACALFLIFAKVITVDEAKKSITVDLIFMLVGIFTLTTALSSTGAGNIVGSTIISLFGGATTEFGLVALFAGITIIITNFMSNNASMYSMIPVAITTAIAAGVNPIPAVLAIDVAAKCSFILPCSSGEAAMCFGASGYTPQQTLKFAVPAIVIYYAALLLGMKLIFHI